MFIRNENIELRVAEPYDANTIYNWENDTSIWRVSETLVPFSLHQIEQFLWNNNDLMSQKQLRLMIDKNDTDTAVGCIDIYGYDAFNQRAGIGILIDKNFRGQGLAKQSIELLMKYCFDTLQLHQVFAMTLADNIESTKLFESMGFVKSGQMKDWYKTADGFVDQIEYQYINKI